MFMRGMYNFLKAQHSSVTT